MLHIANSSNFTVLKTLHHYVSKMQVIKIIELKLHDDEGK